MPSRFLYLASLALLVPLCSSCSKGGEQPQASDVHETPNVSPTAAPGVAWRYSYDFELPDDVIESVQETHASECESLGPAGCRITGLRYSVSNDNAVSAMLEVKLAPEIARQFGKQATGDVRKAGGRLSNTEFTGEDTQPALSAASRNQSTLQTRIADVQKQLANHSLKDAERAQLQSQLDEMKSGLAQTQSGVAETQQRLASTPMTFNYYGKGGISGFAGHNPVVDAARSFVASLVTMITFVLQLLAIVLPWALLLLLVYLVARSRVGRAIGRIFARRSYSENEES